MDSDIDFVHKVDFTKGFTGIRVKWPIKNHKNLHRSSTVQTVVKNGNNQTTFTWNLEIKKEKLGVSFSIILNPADRSIPVILRLALFDPAHGAIFNRGAFQVFRKQRREKCRFDFQEQCIGGNLILHCWLDIPNCIMEKDIPYGVLDRIDNENNILRNTYMEKAWSNLDTLFRTVIDPGLIENGNWFNDVILVVINDRNEIKREFYCHRNILASRSPVFRRMLADGNWKESDHIVEINDIDSDVLEIFLRFIYTGSLPRVRCSRSGHEDLLKLVYAADKYDLSDLKAWCESVLILFYHDDDSRIEQLHVAECHGLKQLKTICITQLCTNWKRFKQEHIEGIIAKDLVAEIIQASSIRQYTMKDIILQ